MSIPQALSPPTSNHILAALPPAEYDRLAPHLEQIEMPLGRILYNADEFIEYGYFPTHAMISLVSQQPDGATVEVGLTGFEGMAPISLVLGVDQSPHQCIVQINDGGVRVRADALRAEFKRGGALHDLLLRYAQSLLQQVSQVAACNRLHSVEERLARWLLMSHDRSVSDELPLTHEFIAQMLGVRRAGVTTAALTLQAEGFIRYTRGRITITDRPGLEDFACPCYRIIKTEFDRLCAGTKMRGGELEVFDDEHVVESAPTY